MNPGRLVIAVFLTMLALPCSGFFVFGMFASFEATNPWPSVTIYAILEVIGLVTMTLAWRWALARRDPRCCERCGYDLTGTHGGPCPECGARPEFQNRVP